MLMIVLKGELATKQSKALICIFKKMKDITLFKGIINDVINNNELILN